MLLNPYLSGALAAEQNMADARRDAERRRLVGSVEGEGPVRRGWLARLLSRPAARRSADRVRPNRERPYGAPQHLGSMKL
ncbi:MAG: hypothetical protein MUF84_15700 [Anaerolineae bacterium]|jgi:hypothetical protein|nr:hypothetical protein [Anaerolineae bacterium]